MIAITEISPPRKVSGLSSFLIQFQYNKNLIDILVGLGNGAAYFHKKDSAWEISLPFLSEVLDRFTYYDDITVKFLDTEAEELIRKSMSEVKEAIKWLPEFLTRPCVAQKEA